MFYPSNYDIKEYLKLKSEDRYEIFWEEFKKGIFDVHLEKQTWFIDDFKIDNYILLENIGIWFMEQRYGKFPHVWKDAPSDGFANYLNTKPEYIKYMKDVYEDDFKLYEKLKRK